MSPASDTLSLIKKAALTIFLEKGVPGLTMRTIAKEVGISAPALYRHYDSHDGILADILKEGFQTFLAYEMKALAGANAWERLMLNGSYYLQFAQENPGFYRLMFMTDLPDIPAVHQAFESDAQATMQFLLDRLYGCMREGFIQEVPPELTAMNIWSVCHGATSLYLGGCVPEHAPPLELVYFSSLGTYLQAIVTDKGKERLLVHQAEILARFS